MTPEGALMRGGSTRMRLGNPRSSSIGTGEGHSRVSGGGHCRAAGMGPRRAAGMGPRRAAGMGPRRATGEGHSQLSDGGHCQVSGGGDDQGAGGMVGISHPPQHRLRPSLCGLAALSVCVMMAVTSVVEGGDLVINEVCYDPAGSDQGQEYVEIFNGSAAPIDLEGVVLEGGNGAQPDAWAVQWSAGDGLQLESGVCLWIGGIPEGVDGEPHAPVNLRLQNGPDAVRLRRGEVVLDLVGWGEHEWPIYYEGEPAVDVASGRALARQSDGVDTDNNAHDFVPAEMLTPGRSNNTIPAIEMEVLEAVPPVARPGQAVAWTARLCNATREPVPGSGVQISWSGASLELLLPEVFEPQTSHDLTWFEEAPDSLGVFAYEFAVSVAERTAAAQSALRVGCGPLVIVEIQFDPEDDEGEWIEVLAREDVPELSGWTLTDAGAQSLTIAAAEALLAGERGLLAEDPAALRVRYPDLPAGLILETEGSWPTLNNTPQDDLGAADALILRDPSGVPSDYAAYNPAPGAGDGVSLERRDPLLPPEPAQDWIPSPWGSSPGAPGAMESLTPARDRLVLEPSFLDRSQGPGCLILPPAAAGMAAWEAGVYDLAGRRLRTLSLQERDGSPVFWWDGCDANGDQPAAGLYVVNVRSWSEAGACRRWTEALTVAP
ncbi:MAG: hypothetical protein GF355_04350 [Candidatus Eisenbacteria bacterium]|nr:hypothetical protein [Candidatus Eisenbacteria bacterium]